MIRNLTLLASLCGLLACGNSVELESGETKVIKLIQSELKKPSGPTAYIDARKIVTRPMIDAAKVPVLFIEIDRGQNGTMTQYPGEGLGQTWLGADGSTVTLENGMLKATRGVGDDLMGSEISRQIAWTNLNESAYIRKLAYLREDNQIKVFRYECTMRDPQKRERVEIFDAQFDLKNIQETCKGDGPEFTNDYWIGAGGLVRKSRQYHGEKIGYATLERLDR